MPKLSDISLYNDANLVAYWELEDLNATIGGYTLTNTGTVAFNAAKFDNGADFGAEGSGKKLSIANDLGLTGNAYSFVGWFKITDAPASGNFLELLNHQGINGTDNEGMRYNNNSGTFEMWFHRVKNGISDETLTVTQTLTVGTFYHIAHTWDGTTMRGYINGVEIGNRGSTGNGSSGITDGFNMSATGGTGGGYIADDVAVFTRALAAAEVLSIYQYSKTLSEVVTVVDTITKATARAFTEVVAIIDAITSSRVVTLILSEIVTITDAITRAITRSFSETVSIIDSILNTLAHMYTKETKPTTSYTKETKTTTLYTKEPR